MIDYRYKSTSSAAELLLLLEKERLLFNLSAFIMELNRLVITIVVYNLIEFHFYEYKFPLESHGFI